MTKGNENMKTITNIFHPAFALFAFAFVALAQQAQATCQNGCDNTTANTFLGDNALLNNTTGIYNTAIGADALYSNTTATGNTATGVLALYTNDTGYSNIASGVYALFSNDVGYE